MIKQDRREYCRTTRRRGAAACWALAAVASLLVAIGAGAPAFAAPQDKKFEFGIYGGYGFPDSYQTPTTRLNPDDDILYGARLGWFFTRATSLELSFQRFASETEPSMTMTAQDFDIDSARLNLVQHFFPRRSFRPFLTFGLGGERTQTDSGLDERDPSLNLGLGLRWSLGHTVNLRLEGRYVQVDLDTPGISPQHNYESMLGISWAFGNRKPADADGDGVANKRDACPDTPRGARVDEKGCPKDSDGDGVPDGIDRCADTPRGARVDASGCPKDSDGDGVPDGIDRCADTPRGARVDASGCPKDSDGDGVFDGIDRCAETPRGAQVDASGCPKDADGDGVSDGIDRCPNTPRGAQVDATGCPKDSDRDGVLDGIDRCPGTPAGTEVDAKGCKKLFEEGRRQVVLEGVRFEFNSATLTSEARAILDRVALSLKQSPGVRVEIGGHTDSQGDDSYNQRLSERRADAVRSYLTDRGVQSSRLTSRGYGEGQPVATNASKEGRKLNRRVELRQLP